MLIDLEKTLNKAKHHYSRTKSIYCSWSLSKINYREIKTDGWTEKIVGLLSSPAWGLTCSRLVGDREQGQVILSNLVYLSFINTLYAIKMPNPFGKKIAKRNGNIHVLCSFFTCVYRCRWKTWKYGGRSQDGRANMRFVYGPLIK